IAIGNQIFVGNGVGYSLNTLQRSTLINNTVRTSTTRGTGIHVLNVGADLINNSVRVVDGTIALQIDTADSTLYNNLLGVAGAGPALKSPSPTDTATTTVVANALWVASACASPSGAPCPDTPTTPCSWPACLAASGNLTSDCGITASDFHIAAGSG